MEYEKVLIGWKNYEEVLKQWKVLFPGKKLFRGPDPKN